DRITVGPARRHPAQRIAPGKTVALATAKPRRVEPDAAHQRRRTFRTDSGVPAVTAALDGCRRYFHFGEPRTGPDSFLGKLRGRQGRRGSTHEDPGSGMAGPCQSPRERLAAWPGCFAFARQDTSRRGRCLATPARRPDAGLSLPDRSRQSWRFWRGSGMLGRYTKLLKHPAGKRPGLAFRNIDPHHYRIRLGVKN